MYLISEFSFINLWFKQNVKYYLSKYYTISKNNMMIVQTPLSFLTDYTKATNLFWYQYMNHKNTLYYHIVNNKCLTIKKTYFSFL